MNENNAKDSSSQGSNKETSSRDEPFPLTLHRMLEEMEQAGFSNVIGWDLLGMSFTVLEPKIFAQRFMQLYFRHTKYKSFQKQLNAYNFKREERGAIRGNYSHPLFIRNDRSLCLLMKRSKKRDLKSLQKDKSTKDEQIDFKPSVGMQQIDDSIQYQNNSTTSQSFHILKQKRSNNLPLDLTTTPDSGFESLVPHIFPTGNAEDNLFHNQLNFKQAGKIIRTTESSFVLGGSDPTMTSSSNMQQYRKSNNSDDQQYLTSLSLEKVKGRKDDADDDESIGTIDECEFVLR